MTEGRGPAEFLNTRRIEDFWDPNAPAGDIGITTHRGMFLSLTLYSLA